MRLLVTGFGPFPSMPRNPSAALASAVASSRRLALHGVRVECRILTTAYATLAHELDPALDRSPDAVLMIGVAGRSRRIRVERGATNRRSTLFPDASGEAAEVAATGGPRERRTRVNPVEALQALERAGVPSRISRDAGRYLCNAAYFRALARRCPVLFIHIPKPAGSRRPARRRLRRTGGDARLVTIALSMLRTARVAGRARHGLQAA